LETVAEIELGITKKNQLKGWAQVNKITGMIEGLLRQHL
jgi:hypothetical protein